MPIAAALATIVRPRTCLLGALAIVAAGVDRHQVPRLERLISTAVLGFAVSEAAGRFRRHEQNVIDEDFRCLLQALGDLVRSHATTTG